MAIDNIADYSQSDKGIIANLTTAEILTPIFDIANQLKILSLEDFTTSGKHLREPTPGAYPLQLKSNFTANNLDVDFIKPLRTFLALTLTVRGLQARWRSLI